MKSPLFIRPLSPEESPTRRAGLRSSSAFTLRRCQILLASAEGFTPSQIHVRLGCATQTVRDALHAVAAEGTACLHAKSHRPQSAHPILDDTRCEQLHALLHRRPRDFGKPTSVWTLALAAEVSHEQGRTERLVRVETIRHAWTRLGVGWKRAKTWITSPDPADLRQKHARDRLIRLAERHADWVLGFQDATWWSRLAWPELRIWAGGEPAWLHQLESETDDPDPKALACYGLVRGDTGGMRLRFVQGRPVRQVTEDFLAWACERLAAEGKRAVRLIWDNASWHVSTRVRSWIKTHHRRVKREGGVRIVACYLPIKAPWLNRIEPCWVHGKRAILEPDRKLTAAEVVDRVHEHFGCEHCERLTQEVA